MGSRKRKSQNNNNIMTYAIAGIVSVSLIYLTLPLVISALILVFLGILLKKAYIGLLGIKIDASGRPRKGPIWISKKLYMVLVSFIALLEFYTITQIQAIIEYLTINIVESLDIKSKILISVIIFIVLLLATKHGSEIL